MHIIVIGSGWAGISAAMHALQRGWKVTVVEDRPYIGGRARSFADKQTGDVIDNGQHVMIGAYTHAQHIMQTLHTEHMLEKQRALRVAFADVRGHRTMLDASNLPGRAGMVSALLRLQSLSTQARIASLRLAIRIMRKQVNATNLTCQEFLQQEHQHADAVEWFWEPLVLATLNAPIHQAAADLLVTVMRLAFLGGRGASSLWIPTKGLSELIAPFPEWLRSHGGALHLNTSVENITLLHDDSIEGGNGIVVSTNNSHQLHAYAVVSTIPQRSLQRILDASAISMHLPQQPTMSPIVSVYLWYSKDWLDIDFTAAIGTTIQWIFNKRSIKPGMVALTVSAAEHESATPITELVAAYDAELRMLFPEMSGAELLHSQVVKEKHATPLITPAVEQSRRTMHNLSTKRFVIAGDWTVAGMPATIEAAARSGAYAISTLERLSTNA